MKKHPPPAVCPSYLESARRSTPEQRLEWLAAAVIFAEAAQKKRRSRRS